MTNTFRQSIIDDQISGSIHDAKGYKYDRSAGWEERLERDIKRFGNAGQKYQGTFRQELIDLIIDSQEDVFCMLTIHPHWDCDKDQIESLGKAIKEIFHKRFNPHNRHQFIAPILTFYEPNANKHSYHIHMLLPLLPHSMLNVWHNNKQGLEAHNIVCKILGHTPSMDEAGNEIYSTVGLENDKEYHSTMYNFALNHPYKASDWHIKQLQKIPNGRRGRKFSLVDETKSFDCFFGWKGLVAYCTKFIFDQETMHNVRDPFIHAGLINFIELNIHRDVQHKHNNPKQLLELSV